MQIEKLKEIELAKRELKELLRKADFKVYTILRQVSKSGMYRHISLILWVNNEPINLDWKVSKILSMPLKNDGIGISGCGMDMGFHIVYNLGRTLYPTKQEAQKLQIMTGRNGSKEYETDGGYCLVQRWL